MKTRIFDLLSGSYSFSPRAKKIWKLVFGILWIASIAYLIWSAWQSWPSIAQMLIDADYGQIFLATLYYLGSAAAAVITWGVIIRAFENSPGWWDTLQIYFATLAARRLPGTVWYVVGRTALYEKHGMAKLSVLIASVFEMIVTLAVGGVLGVLILGAIGELPPLILTACVAGIGLAGLAVIQPRVFAALLRRSGYPAAMRMKSSRYFLSILTTAVTWGMGGQMVVHMVKILRPELSLHDTLYILGVWCISGMAGYLTLFLPSSLGATELTLMAFLTGLLPLPLAGSVAIGIRFFTLLMDVLVSVVFYAAFARLLAPPPDGDEANRPVG